MTELVTPTLKYKESYLRGLLEFHEERFLLKLKYNKIANDFVDYIKEIEGKSRGLGLPDGYSPQTEYWLVEGNEYLGTIQLRHHLNSQLLKTEGNIGYHIRPSERRKGYGKMILSLILPEAKKIGLNKVLITCDENNTASMKIIETNGGFLENVVENGAGKPRRMRFWIQL